ncbi:glycosyltransferase family 4 protein [Dyella sp. LX-66]|uniref:glycosyltransferase family 4 protein n=1 Tax=unclassified Dyella TaxID=2634549 RepID=UPI001BE02F8B|nr:MULTISPECIES: glycosyltransferase family 4 protein [unclassified Dyella]MBT2118813.1 glycosyltransferase family 4 protein [Dyella sp. LX-1]MBT2141162.1 glycosyltransferase family 4 protein [Dyella sp. LX-66]
MAEDALRILVIGNLPPHVLGGAENQVARLAAEWAKAGASVEVAGHRIPDGVQDLSGQAIRTHRIHTWAFGGRLGRAIGYVVSMAGLVMRNRQAYDVVYCRGISDGLLCLVMLKSIRLCRWPIVACPINARGAGDAAFVRSIPGWRWLVRLIDRHVQVINLINTAIADDLAAIGIERPALSRVPNGIAVSDLAPRLSVAKVRRLVWTGRYSEQKGLDLLFPALATCRKQGIQFRLDLFGDGARREALIRQVAQLGLADCVFFRDPVEVDAVRSVLMQADIFVLPSRYEGMSNSALEAMEAGLPVLCTRCGGIDVYVDGEAGWVCNPDSVDQLTEALLQMFGASDGEVLRAGRCARELVELRFAIEAVAAANLSLLSQAAGRGEAYAPACSQ